MSYDNSPPSGENLHPVTLPVSLSDDDEALLESISHWAASIPDVNSVSMERISSKKDAHIMRVFFSRIN